MPARVYTASDALGRYSTTVVDYRNIEKLHADRAAKCRAAKGDGDSCQNDFRVDLAGATDHAVWDYMKRDGVKITHYMFYFVELVSGRLLQMTNPDQTRTFAAIHQHAGRLYIHQATVSAGMPEPILFMQGLAWADERAGDQVPDDLHGRLRRVEVSQRPAAAHRAGSNTSIDGTIPPKK